MQLRLVWPVALISLFLLGLCTALAVALFRQQSRLADVQGENISSLRAAADLEESLTDLIALLQVRVEGAVALHGRIEAHLDAIREYADQDKERDLSAKLDASYARYLAVWETLPHRGRDGHDTRVREAITILETETLRECQELRQFNSRRIEEAASDYRRVLRELAWGIAGVGASGSVAGLILGYGVARGLSRSIRRLQVQIQDVAGKLGPDRPAIVLTGEGDLDRLDVQMQGLVQRVEEVVARLQQREREVLRAEQLAAVGQLAAGVAHEIRNPLTSIKMLVQAGREGDPPGGLASDDLEVIEREVRRMERSLKTFLDFARPPKPERREIELAPVIRHTLDLVRGRAVKQRVEVRFDPPAEPVRLFADPEMLRQVFVNLALNALDVMPAGGRLEIALEPLAGTWVRAVVRDTGPGVAPEIEPRLFQPFVSSKETGLGLGLVTSRRIVEDHGGTLTTANPPGGGACFYVRLPTV